MENLYVKQKKNSIIVVYLTGYDRVYVHLIFNAFEQYSGQMKYLLVNIIKVYCNILAKCTEFDAHSIL